MRWRVVLSAVAVFVPAIVGASSSRSRLTERPLTLAGWVRSSTSEEGLVTAVTGEARQPTPDGTDVVDQAFRLQHVRPHTSRTRGRPR